MKYIGLDIHKKDTQASVLDEKGKFVHGERIRTDVNDIGHFFEKIERMDDDDPSVVIEATGFYFWNYNVIVERGHQVKVVHPTRVKPLMRARMKNDRNDALMLAELLRMGCLEGIHVPDREVGGEGADQAPGVPGAQEGRSEAGDHRRAGSARHQGAGRASHELLAEVQRLAALAEGHNRQ